MKWLLVLLMIWPAVGHCEELPERDMGNLFVDRDMTAINRDVVRHLYSLTGPDKMPWCHEAGGPAVDVLCKTDHDRLSAWAKVFDALPVIETPIFDLNYDNDPPTCNDCDLLNSFTYVFAKGVRCDPFAYYKGYVCN